VAKIRKPRDILDDHAYVDRRLTWLELQSTNEPPVVAPVVSHVHDIVEHLFRGSVQAHTGAAPFGHLAAHYWECEHDDPSLIGNWEFHRKMRLMRERVGANRRLVDRIRSNYGIFIGTGTVSGRETVYVNGKGKDSHLGYKPPASKPHPMSLYTTGPGGVWQSFMLPSGPGWYGEFSGKAGFGHWYFTYEREAYEAENPETHEKYTVPEYRESTENGENPAYQTAGEVGPEPKPAVVATEHNSTITNAANVYHDEARGNTIQAESRRWAPEEFDENFESAATYPSPELDGTSPGPHAAIISMSGANEIPDDIIVWSGNGEGEGNVGGGLMVVNGPQGENAREILEGKEKLWASYPPSDKSGVYGGMWYLAYSSKAFAPNGMYVWIPADFIQSPGPPEDFTNTQEETVDMFWPTVPEQSCDNAWAFGPAELPPNPSPLRTFAEAITFFEEEIVKPEFAVLKAWWERHLESFTKSGSAYNQAWTRADSNIFGGGGYVEYMVRYGWCHLRGRLAFSKFVGSDPELWDLTEVGLPKSIKHPATDDYTGTTLDFMCNSDKGLVRARLFKRDDTGEDHDLVFEMPDYGADVGSSSTGPAWIDLDGIAYPCEES
jgi:hypothetical protein